MEQLIRNAGKQTPQIFLDGDKGFFSFADKSYPENANDFYNPILEYIELYKLNPKDKTTIEFNWLYYNTATSKIIVKIILLLKDISSDFEVRWLCSKDADLIIEKGQEIKEVLQINLNIIHP